jgi:hypothetical protein
VFWKYPEQSGFLQRRARRICCHEPALATSYLLARAAEFFTGCEELFGIFLTSLSFLASALISTSVLIAGTAASILVVMIAFRSLLLTALRSG